MPNTFAYAALLIWPLFVVGLFRVLPLSRALAWSIVGGVLFLPTQAAFNLPAIPALDKNSLPSVVAALMCLLCAGKKSGDVRRRNGLTRFERGEDRSSCSKELDGAEGRSGSFGDLLIGVLILLLLVNPFITTFTNTESVIAGPRVIGGLTLYDAVSTAGNALVMLVPFLLARRYLSTPESHRDLLAVLVTAGIVYSFLVLFEARMSPRLNIWIYGFFPHSWVQHLRGGGYRAIVFLEHGLAVGIFLVAALVSACALWRSTLLGRVRNRKWKYAAVFIAIALVFSKNFGALLLGFFLAAVALRLGRRRVVAVAALSVVVVLTYPVLRANDWIPADRAVEYVRRVSAERAGSLEFRFDQERLLLDRASEKPISGWGGYGRWRVYDDLSGRDSSVSDGLWVIIKGQSGWLGFLAMFGLLGMPIIFLWRSQAKSNHDMETIGLTLILAAILLYAIPNAFLGPIYWLVAGALAGYYRRVHGRSRGTKGS